MPWGADTSELTVVVKKATGQLQALSGVPAHVGAAVMRMLSVSAGERYPSCAAFVDALRRDGEGEKRAAAERAARERAEREAKERSEREARERGAKEQQARAERETAAKEKAERDARERAAKEQQARAQVERDAKAFPVATPEHAARTERLSYSVRASVRTMVPVEVTREVVVSEGILGFGRKVEQRVFTEQQERLSEGEIAFSMVVVPPCRFTMGSPPSESNRSSDETQHEVRLTRAYAMATTPVTQALYQAVMGTNPSNFKDGAEAPQRPVEQVSWFDAVRFCNALSVKVGLRAAYEIGSGDAPSVRAIDGADGFRLPTEAEWECAARAGAVHVYAGGDDLDAVAWHSGNSGRTTHAVGQKRANAWGLHDVSGNVWEWCHDWYGDYASGVATDPQGAASGSSRVARGGGWGVNAQNARVARRFGYAPGSRYDFLGFRLSRTIP
jgi:formylglycine-generating enzyme required for sulfatase activity